MSFSNFAEEQERAFSAPKREPLGCLTEQYKPHILWLTKYVFFLYIAADVDMYVHIALKTVVQVMTKYAFMLYVHLIHGTF